MINKKQDDPPLEWIHPEKAMAIWIVSVVLILIASILFLCFARIPEEKVDYINFQYEKVQDGDPLHITKDGLIVQAPPYLFTEHTTRATITAYSSSVDECDDTPFITASGTRTRLGVIACPVYYKFGEIFKIDGEYYICEDRMSTKYPHRFDIWFPSKQEAKEFGIKIKEITYYKLVK